MSPKEAREYRKFETELYAVLVAFETAKEWADLSNCLIKLYKVFNVDVSSASAAPSKNAVKAAEEAGGSGASTVRSGAST